MVWARTDVPQDRGSLLFARLFHVFPLGCRRWPSRDVGDGPVEDASDDLRAFLED